MRTKKGLSSFHPFPREICHRLTCVIFFMEGFCVAEFWGVTVEKGRVFYTQKLEWWPRVRGRVTINGDSVIQGVPLERYCLQGDGVAGQGEMFLNWRRLRLGTRKKLIDAEKSRHQSGVSVTWIVTHWEWTLRLSSTDLAAEFSVTHREM